jgi:ferritin
MLDIFEQVSKHEQKVTALINKLYELALQEKDYPSQVMLQWFINEQVEEEKNATQLVEQIKLCGDKPGALMYIDRHVGKRGEK